MTDQISMTKFIGQLDVTAAPFAGYGSICNPCEPTPSAESRIAEALDFLKAYSVVDLDSAAVAFASIDSWRVVQEALTKAAAESKTLQ